MVRNTGHRGGRHSKLTPELQAVIIESLSKHNYVSTSCQLAGISDTTFYHWLELANKYKEYLTNPRNLDKDYKIAEGKRYSDFQDAVSQAQAGSESQLLGRIDEAGSVSTMIEQRTINHTLKDGSTKTETLERWKPPDWQANAWILERTRWEKFGQHSSLDIHQAGVVFIERLQQARQQAVVEGEFREINDIANEPKPEEIAPERPVMAMIAGPKKAEAQGAPRRRPILELIARAKQRTGASSSDNAPFKNRPQSQTDVAQRTKCDMEAGQAEGPAALEAGAAPRSNLGVDE